MKLEMGAKDEWIIRRAIARIVDTLGQSRFDEAERLLCHQIGRRGPRASKI
jgi:hypothetical protein